MKTLNGFLIIQKQMTLKVYNVWKLHRPRMSHGLLADNVDTTFVSLLCSCTTRGVQWSARSVSEPRKTCVADALPLCGSWASCSFTHSHTSTGKQVNRKSNMAIQGPLHSTSSSFASLLSIPSISYPASLSTARPAIPTHLYQTSLATIVEFNTPRELLGGYRLYQERKASSRDCYITFGGINPLWMM